MAANDRILVDTADLEAAIQKYVSVNETLQEAFKKLDSAKEHLDRCYKGAAYMALSAKLMVQYANARTAENAVRESENGLRQTISSMGATTEDTQRLNNLLDVGRAAPVYQQLM